MSRKNLEDTVLNYFTTAPLAAAELMLRIAAGAVKRRRGLDQVKAAARRVEPRRTPEPRTPQPRTPNVAQPV